MIKKILPLLLLTLLFLPFQIGLAQSNSTASEDEITVYFFWGEGCPHCADEKPFLAELEQRHDDVTVRDFEVWYDAENRKLLQDVGSELGIAVSGVPFTVIGENYVIGWYSDHTTGAEVEGYIARALSGDYRDVVASLLERNTGTAAPPEEETEQNAAKNSPIPETINVPILGELETKNISLPTLSVVLGVLDGFNPCAMWALLFLISLLIGMKDRKRMWVFGTVFIVGSAAVYFMFMAAWLNLLLFIGVVFWVRALIGFLALWGGWYNLREFFQNKDATCKVTGAEKRRRVFDRLKEFTQQKNFWLGLLGILVLAFSVNLVELICSAGLPAVFTQVLALSDLATWQYYGYILLYIFFFMIDDLFVFFVAMKTLQATGITTKYARFSHLIGGILMLIIGLLLILKPEWLMFG